MKIHAIAIAILCVIPACQGPKARALGAIDDTQAHIQAAQQDAGALLPYVEKKGIPIHERLTSRLQQATDTLVGKAKPSVQQLKDPEGWLGTVKKIAVVLALLALLYFMGNAGLLPLMGHLISWLASMGIMTSKTVANEAALALKTEHDPASRELIAAKRMSRADFNGSYLRAKKLEKAKRAGL